MYDRSRFLKHLTAHRIADTELQVISDLDSGVTPLIDVEKEVLGEYTRRPDWQHGVIVLFVLRNLEPLIRQLSQVVSAPPGGIQALEYRPIVNIYDLRNPYACRIFINQEAMKREGYWDDHKALKALLAHEHAHPLAECPATQASRNLRVELSFDSIGPQLGESKTRQSKIEGLLRVVIDKLCLYAPREIFANDVTIQSGFADPLLYLDKQNVIKAGESLRSKGILRQELQKEVERENLTALGADLLATIAEMKGYLDLALETAPFHRQNKVAELEELEGLFFERVIPYLEPEVGRAYERLRDGYVKHSTNASPEELARDVESLLDVLAAVLRDKGLELGYKILIAPEREGKGV